MSKNHRNFSSEFKTKLVIELLESGKTLKRDSLQIRRASQKPYSLEEAVYRKRIDSLRRIHFVQKIQRRD